MPGANGKRGRNTRESSSTVYVPRRAGTSPDPAYTANIEDQPLAGALAGAFQPLTSKALSLSWMEIDCAFAVIPIARMTATQINRSLAKVSLLTATRLSADSADRP